MIHISPICMALTIGTQTLGTHIVLAPTVPKDRAYAAHPPCLHAPTPQAAAPVPRLLLIMSITEFGTSSTDPGSSTGPPDRTLDLQRCSYRIQDRFESPGRVPDLRSWIKDLCSPHPRGDLPTDVSLIVIDQEFRTSLTIADSTREVRS